jgi:hypothetical protein
MAPIDLLSSLVSDELACRSQRLLERRHKQAQFRDPNKHLDNFDFQFNPKMNRNLIFDLATAAWVGRRDDSLFLEPPGSGKTGVPGDGFFRWGGKPHRPGHRPCSYPAGYRVLYREAHKLLEELTDATLDGKAKRAHGPDHHGGLADHRRSRYAQAATDSSRTTAGNYHAPVPTRQHSAYLQPSRRRLGQALRRERGVSAMLDRLLHHGHVLKCGPRSWRTKTSNPGQSQ